MKLFGKLFELVILDVDGVILDLDSCFQKNLESAAGRCDLAVGPIRDYLGALHAGEPVEHASLKDGVYGFWPTIDPSKAAEFITCFREEEYRTPYPPVEGSIEAIQWLRQHHVPLALCTTNERKQLEYRLEAVGIDLRWFTTLSTWESPYPKPDPRALDPIFEAISVPRDHAIYVGDWYPDITAARGAGVRFIAVLSGGVPRHAFVREGVPEDHILERFADLPKLIQLD